jgi:PD-(D/E)XK nuclease superfamily
MTCVDAETYAPFEVHEMPNGAEVFYRSSDHSYWAEIQHKAGRWTGIQAQRLTGVTTGIAPLDFKPDNLMRWACRQECEGVAWLAADGLSAEEPDDMRAALAWLQSGDAVRGALADARLLHTDKRDDAAGRGTNIHKHALHALASGRPVPLFDAMTEEERGYALGIVAAWHELEPKPLLSERVVFSAEHRIAGRPDLVAMVGDKRTLWDAKTSTSSFIPAKHHAQLALYDLCLEECGYGATDEQAILMVRPDGTYELVPCEATREDAIAALKVYRAAARINSACAKRRKETEKT